MKIWSIFGKFLQRNVFPTCIVKIWQVRVPHFHEFVMVVIRPLIISVINQAVRLSCCFSEIIIITKTKLWHRHSFVQNCCLFPTTFLFKTTFPSDTIFVDSTLKTEILIILSSVFYVAFQRSTVNDCINAVALKLSPVICWFFLWYVLISFHRCAKCEPGMNFNETTVVQCPKRWTKWAKIIISVKGLTLKTRLHISTDAYRRVRLYPFIRTGSVTKKYLAFSRVTDNIQHSFTFTRNSGRSRATWK